MHSNNFATSFGKKIRSLREEKNLSLKELSIKTGIDASLLGKLERDERTPSRSQIKIFACFYKFNEQYLIRENLSDLIAYKVFEANSDLEIFRVAEKKIKYLKTTKGL